MAKLFSNAYLEAVAKALPDVPAYLLNDDGTPVAVGLFANDINPDPAAGKTQFAAPGYAGYATQAFPPTAGAPFVYFDDNTATWYVKLGTGFFFQPTGDTGLPATVYGWFLAADGSTFIMAERFDDPFTFTTPDDGIEVNPAMGFPLLALV